MGEGRGRAPPRAGGQAGGGRASSRSTCRRPARGRARPARSGRTASHKCPLPWRMGNMAEKSAGKRARELNEQIRYIMYAVFRVRTGVGDGREALATEVDALLDQLA